MTADFINPVVCTHPSSLSSLLMIRLIKHTKQLLEENEERLCIKVLQTLREMMTKDRGYGEKVCTYTVPVCCHLLPVSKIHPHMKKHFLTTQCTIVMSHCIKFTRQHEVPSQQHAKLFWVNCRACIASISDGVSDAAKAICQFSELWLLLYLRHTGTFLMTNRFPHCFLPKHLIKD